MSVLFIYYIYCVPMYVLRRQRGRMDAYETICMHVHMDMEKNIKFFSIPPVFVGFCLKGIYCLVYCVCAHLFLFHSLFAL